MIRLQRWLPLSAALIAVSAQIAAAQIPATIHSVSSNLKDGTGFDRTAAYAIDGSGFSDGTHSIGPEGTMWLNNGTFAAPNDLEPEITFNLGAVQDVASMTVWNYNETLPDRPELLGRGIGSADILIAGEDLVFSTLISAQEFTVAPGVEDVDFGQTIELNTSARYVKLDILGNLGGDNNFVGLSEVQFTAVPEPASLTSLLLGIAVLSAAKRRRQ